MRDSLLIFNPTAVIDHSPNPLLLTQEGTTTAEDFNTFINLTNENKIFFIPELLVRKILNEDITDFGLLGNYIPHLILKNINILIDISTGEISPNQYNRLLELFSLFKTPHKLITILVNTRYEYEILSALSSDISVVCTQRNEILFFDDLYLKKRPKRFLFLSRRFTVERLFIFLDLRQRKILDNAFFSFTFNLDPYHNSVPYTDYMDQLFTEFAQNTSYENRERSEFIIDYWQNNKKEILTNSPYVFGTDVNRYQHDEALVNKFNESHISLCVETAILKDPSHFQPSEKIYKCCYYRHPFFVYSTPNFLNHWNQTGYQSFSNVFDESYDNDLDTVGRIFKINDQVEKINEMKHYQLIDTLHKCQPILNHNQNLLSEKFLHPKQKNLYFNKNNLTDRLLNNKFIINEP